MYTTFILYIFFVSFTDEARRIISAGGFYINSQRINDVNHIVDNFKLSNGITLLRVGKINYKNVSNFIFVFLFFLVSFLFSSVGGNFFL